MAAPGNQYWKMRSKHGRNPTYATAEDLWSACVEYFEWVEENPLLVDTLVTYEGDASHVEVKRMRAMTLTGLYIFLEIGKSTWKLWREERKDLKDVIERVEAVIYTQKFEGAAAGILNASIIARDLGLAEKTDATVNLRKHEDALADLDD